MEMKTEGNKVEVWGSTYIGLSMFTYSPHSSILGSLRVQVPLTLSTHSSSSERVGTHSAGRKEDNALYKCEVQNQRTQDYYTCICAGFHTEMFSSEGGGGGGEGGGHKVRISKSVEARKYTCTIMFNVG